MSSYKDQILQLKRTVFSYPVSNNPDPYFALWRGITQFYSNYGSQRALLHQPTPPIIQPAPALPTKEEPFVKAEAKIKKEPELKVEPKEEETKFKIEPEWGLVPKTSDDVKDEPDSTEASHKNLQFTEDIQINISVKTGQSQYKNKLKEPLERAKVILKDLCKFTPNRFMIVQQEANRSDNDWLLDGEKIRGDYEKVEAELDTLTGLKGKIVRRSILQKIVDKKYCLFTGLFQYKKVIQDLMAKSDLIHNFKEYKDRISHVYFKRTIFEKQEDLLSWILLVSIGALILPSNRERIDFLPLTKENIYFNYWLIESPMKPHNKQLYRQHHIRDHLRGVLLEAGKNLVEQGYRRLSHENLALMIGMLKAINMFNPPSNSDFQKILARKERCLPMKRKEKAKKAEKEKKIVKQQKVEKIMPKVEINVKRFYDEIKAEAGLEDGEQAQKIVCKEENK